MSSNRPQSETGFARHSKALSISAGPLICLPVFVFLPVFVLLIAGCASPGPPRPASLQLPALVTDLKAEHVGDRVLLSWTTPSRTTDDLPVKGDMAAQICRETGARPATPAGRLAACAPVLRLAVSPGISEVVDTLPRPLTADPVSLVTYRVQIFNALGRSAGDSSMAALAAAGAAPVPVEAFSASAGESGAILEWRRPQFDGSPFPVDVKMRDLSVASPPKSTTLGARPVTEQGRRPKGGTSAPQPPPTGEIHLRTPDLLGPSDSMPKGDLSGTVVSTAKMGGTYTFVAKRVRSVTAGGHLLEIYSEPSSVVTLTMRDIFPPRSPSGLAAIPSIVQENKSNPPASPDGRAYIDLSWEPNTESDLAGYVVYRRLARRNGDPQGPLARLTQVPISAPAYRDMAVVPGQRYIYSVTAVDASGNESAQSAQAQEVIPSL